ncbi:hypothetical protein EUGRSUZ_J00990 [Eucalyptus grandis]|uniref:Uncharacterized protein n=2 Tax=Eucalyptus grandis TaxID=71139 RepID=A0ACC3J6I6_EUCGR|nr:hypothetical protein EUGRSUZ_J00990 [Eucalyptus grandis]
MMIHGLNSIIPQQYNKSTIPCNQDNLKREDRSGHLFVLVRDSFGQLSTYHGRVSLGSLEVSSYSSIVKFCTLLQVNVNTNIYI